MSKQKINRKQMPKQKEHKKVQKLRTFNKEQSISLLNASSIELSNRDLLKSRLSGNLIFINCLEMETLHKAMAKRGVPIDRSKNPVPIDRNVDQSVYL